MYRFQVIAPTQVGEFIGLVGSTPELGEWDALKAIPLQTSNNQYPLWWVEINLNSIPAPKIEYKYLRFTAGGIEWKRGNQNRTVPIEPEYQEQTIIVDDGHFHQIKPYPYGYFAAASQSETFPEQAQNPKVLVVGSSVALGCSAWLLKGWAWHLEQSLREQYGYQLVNRSSLGANVTSTMARFRELLTTEQPQIVIIALSLGNEGLAFSPSHQKPAIQRRFEDGLQKLIAIARELGARPIIGGLYPHDQYSLEDYLILQATRERLLSWGVPVLDWLSVLDDGRGRWKEDLGFDPAHPNTKGQQVMYQAIDLRIFAEIGEKLMLMEETSNLVTIFDDGQLKILQETEELLLISNQSEYEYNVHPMWSEVRSALRKVKPGVYEDPEDPEKPFRTLIIGDGGLESRVKVPPQSSVYFQYQCSLAARKRIAVIPIGDRCAVRMLLYKLGLDGPAFPFDLTRTSNLGDIVDIIAQGFSDMWNPQLLHYNRDEKRIYHSRWWGLSFGHEVEDSDNPIENMTPIFERMRTRYSARAARFQYTLAHSDELLFIRTGGFSKADIHKLISQLQISCPGKPFRLLVISLQPPEGIEEIPGVYYRGLELNPDRMYADAEHWNYCTGIMGEILKTMGISSRNLFWCPPQAPVQAIMPK